MVNESLNSSVLQDFLLDAQVLLTQAEECLQHLNLIDNDPDACHCLNDTLATLVDRARLLGLVEVASYSQQLQQLLEATHHSAHLPGSALPALEECLTLLAWQLELIDPRTGRLSLDTDEQVVLLDNLAAALHPVSIARPAARA
ncbi:histidine kinase [Pseudomonas alkylphenolica]|uniref:histidine kinase n=1 Tax=Pseudomonas alkylphenolica TaxID=237609 RepID=UPI0018D94B02|nr:histidine kinase [Pseudomonas alkylphenolica]MBH3427385.1 histidine kinase [Pseudomonas alkylphenolica]